MANRVTWRGDIVSRQIENAAMRGLREAAELVLTEAHDDTPLDTGTLRRSGIVTPAYRKMFISFNTPYARRQHEELGYFHPVGKAKYLEDTLRRNFRRIVEYVGRRIHQMLR